MIDYSNIGKQVKYNKSYDNIDNYVLGTIIGCYIGINEQYYVISVESKGITEKIYDDSLLEIISSGGGGSSVTVESLTVTQNNTYTAPSGKAYSPVVVNVTPNLQSKTNIIPGTHDITVTPDNGYDGLSSVQIDGDADLVAGNIKKDVSIFGVTGTYEGSSINTPLVNSSVTFSSTSGSFEISLPRTPTNFVVMFEADNTSLEYLYGITDTVYAAISGNLFYPLGNLDNGSYTAYKFNVFRRYRPSTKQFYAQSGASLSLSGTTLTVSLDNATKFYSGTTYLVKVWEVAT